MVIKYYKLELVERSQGGIQTACLLCCNMCGVAISGMGGPGSGQLCLECGGKILDGTAKMVIDD